MPPAAHTLDRSLTVRDLVGIVIGTTIGSGIFIVPAAVLRQTGGDVGPALVVWLIGGVLSLLGALTYGEMGAADPDAGGQGGRARDDRRRDRDQRARHAAERERARRDDRPQGRRDRGDERAPARD